MLTAPSVPSAAARPLDVGPDRHAPFVPIALSMDLLPPRRV